MKKNLSLNVLSLAIAVLAIACGAGPEGEDDLTGGNKKKGGNEEAGDPGQCVSREYVGLGDVKLHAERTVANAGVDRGRIKPFSALKGEYRRVLGAVPASLTGTEPTFGEIGRTWYEEPRSSAVAVQTAYAVAFDGCLTYTAKAEYDAAPDATSAAAKCAAMARSFWSKTASPKEIAACAEVATTGAESEPEPRRKWAYACAAVLTSAGFLSY